MVCVVRIYLKNAIYFSLANIILCSGSNEREDEIRIASFFRQNENDYERKCSYMNEKKVRKVQEERNENGKCYHIRRATCFSVVAVIISY